MELEEMRELFIETLNRSWKTVAEVLKELTQDNPSNWEISHKKASQILDQLTEEEIAEKKVMENTPHYRRRHDGDRAEIKGKTPPREKRLALPRVA